MLLLTNDGTELSSRYYACSACRRPLTEDEAFGARPCGHAGEVLAVWGAGDALTEPEPEPPTLAERLAAFKSARRAAG